MKILSLKLTAIAITLFTITFSSCKKDDATDQPCKLSKAYYYDGASITDSATFTYANNKVTRVDLSDIHYTLEYSGENVSKRNIFYPNSSTADEYHLITYGANNTISKVELFEKTSGTNYAVYYRYEFTYTGDNITKITVNNVTGGVTTKEEEYVYTYTGNNITTVAATDFTNTPSMTETINYTYDSNPNFFKKQAAQNFFIDPLFVDIDATLLPLALSANNATMITFGGIPISIEYILDQKQNLKDFKVLGELFVRYAYQCP